MNSGARIIPSLSCSLSFFLFPLSSACLSVRPRDPRASTVHQRAKPHCNFSRLHSWNEPLSFASHTVELLELFWIITKRTACFHFILSNILRETSRRKTTTRTTTTTTTRRTARTLPSRLYLLILDVCDRNARNGRTRMFESQNVYSATGTVAINGTNDEIRSTNLFQSRRTRVENELASSVICFLWLKVYVFRI